MIHVTRALRIKLIDDKQFMHAREIPHTRTFLNK